MTRPSQDTSRDRPRIDWQRIQRVLLVRLRSIGDTVLMTPCLKALKESQPGVEIGVVTEPLAAPVLEGHPLVDHLFVVRPSTASRLSLIPRLRRQSFDLAFNLHGGTSAMVLTAMSGARHTVGYRGQRGSRLLNERAPAPSIILGREQIHSVEQQLALLKWAGLQLPDHPRLSIAKSTSAMGSVRTRLVSAGIPIATLASARFAIVAPGAAFESKRWPSRGFASVIDHLKERWQLESLVIAGPGQDQIATQVAAASRAKPPAMVSLSLAEVIALIGSFGGVFVSNDSGPMHIAAALGCPLVSVFGSSNPDVWHPWTNSAYRVLGGERGVADGDVRSAIDRVTVEQVTAAVDDVLESAATRTLSGEGL